MNALSEFEKFKEKLVANIDVQRGQCWFLHPWGRWGDGREFQLTRGESVIGKGFIQYRWCQRCGKIGMQRKQWKF
jgi:hypothetical protein